MTQSNSEEYSCQEIIELINRLVDNELDEEKLEHAQKLIDENPQCCALSKTLMKTVDLCRKQHQEMAARRTPEIRWEEIMERAESEPEME